MKKKMIKKKISNKKMSKKKIGKPLPPFEYITGIVRCSVKELLSKTPPEYQRDIQELRVIDVAGLIEEWTWAPGSIITANELGQIIDGYHRCLACLRVGIVEVPTIKVKFRNKTLEAKYFVAMNEYNTSLKLHEVVAARYTAGDPGIKMLYDLEKDGRCVLRHTINLKFPGEKFVSSRNKFPVSVVGEAISQIFTIPRLKSKRDLDSVSFEEKLRDIKYSTLRKHLNGLFGAIIELYMPGTSYRQGTHVKACAKTYALMKETSQQTDIYFKEKLGKFSPPPGWFTKDYTNSMRVRILCEHLNKGIRRADKKLDLSKLDA